MPCMVDPVVRKRGNYRKMRRKMQKAARAACEALRELHRLDGIRYVSGSTRRWWKKHQRYDLRHS